MGHLYYQAHWCSGNITEEGVEIIEELKSRVRQNTVYRACQCHCICDLSKVLFTRIGYEKYWVSQHPATGEGSHESFSSLSIYRKIMVAVLMGERSLDSTEVSTWTSQTSKLWPSIEMSLYCCSIYFMNLWLTWYKK